MLGRFFNYFIITIFEIMKTHLLLIFASAFVFTRSSAQIQNIQISTDLYTGNEPSIIYSAINANTYMVAANNGKCFVSHDTCRTWATMVTLYENPGTSNPIGADIDPCVISDTAGNFYYFSTSYYLEEIYFLMNGIDRILCQKSTDNAQSFDTITHLGYNGRELQEKPWAAVDPQTNAIYATWTRWMANGDTLMENDSTVVMFTKSTDGAMTWSNPIRINSVAGGVLDYNIMVNMPMVTVGPNSEVYLVYIAYNKIMFNKSVDGGNTWLDNAIEVTDIPGTWFYNVPGIYFPLAVPNIVCSANGMLYVNWTDQRNGVDDTDVWLKKSADGGMTWSAPIRVNNDLPGKHQFASSIAIDNTDDNMYVLFYDRRNYNDRRTDAYIAKSTNGGATFINYKINTDLVTEDVSYASLGHYTSITARNGIIRPAWVRYPNPSTGFANPIILTALIEKGDLLLSAPETPTAVSLKQSYPNPATNEVYIPFFLHTEAEVTITLYNNLGQQVAVLANKEMEEGQYSLPFNLNQYSIAPGVYYCKIAVNSASFTQKIIFTE